MPKIERLPSGNYRVRIPWKDQEGKKHRKSLTAPDRPTLRRMMAEYEIAKDSARPEDMTIADALDAFLASRASLLSPGTLRGYTSLAKMLKSRHAPLCAILCGHLRRSELQALVNRLKRDGASPKTIRNYTGLISAALKAYGFDTPPVTLPRRSKPEYHIPSEEDVQTLAAAASGTDMEIPLTLAVMGLRRGEICALRPEDIDGNVAHIRRAVVYDYDGNLIEKAPKTASSDRFVQIPDETARKIADQGFVTLLSPRQLSRRFTKLVRDSGITPFRFHDLRHFFVSYCHTILKLSDAQIQALGGWSTPHVMNNFYRQTMNQKQAAMLVANKISALIK